MGALVSLQREFQTVPPGRQLSVVVASFSTVLVRGYAETVVEGENGVLLDTITTPGTRLYGPYITSQRVGVECSLGACLVDVVSADSGQQEGMSLRGALVPIGSSTLAWKAGTQLVNPATGLVYGQADGVGGRQQMSPETQALVSGGGIVDAVSRSITAADNGRSLQATAALTYTIPAGLSPMPSFSVDCPAAGAVTIAVTGGATINGASANVTRSRASNPVGFVVLAHSETDAYGVSGS